MLSVIRSFHEGMTAVVRVVDDITDDTEVTNGLRQGCILALTLFNLYFSAMVLESKSSGRSHSQIQGWEEACGGQNSKIQAPGS